MSILLTESPARLEGLAANPSGFDPAFDLLAGLGVAADDNQGRALESERDVDQSPELSNWQSFLAEFIWPDFDSRPAAVVSFTWPLIFPVRGWRFSATAAFDLLPAGLRQRIVDAGARGATAVFVSAAGEITEGHCNFWIDPAPDTSEWPGEIEDAERTAAYGSDEADPEAMNEGINSDRFIPTPAQISEAARAIRKDWTPEQFETAQGRQARQRSRTAVFGNMTDRSLDPGDD